MAVGSGETGPVLEVGGIRVAAVESAIRYRNRLDLVLIEIASDANVAAVFTRNAFCAAPVQVAKAQLAATGGKARYLLINTGNANAGTGQKGLEDARTCCRLVAEASRLNGAAGRREGETAEGETAEGGTAEGAEASQVLPFSTGVIGENLPVARLADGIPRAFAALNKSAWLDAAKGIMTTDTRPKVISAQLRHEDRVVTITGFAKGSGMIKPNMATLLSFVFTDAAIEPGLLQELLSQAVNRSFNRITVDGDTSTNDACTLTATGASGVQVNREDSAFFDAFNAALQQLFQDLAIGLIKDAEGANKFITVRVEQGADAEECLKVAYAVAESPLVKTALFASDPNWGRILAAVGRAGLTDLDVSAVSIHLGEVCIVDQGTLATTYREELGQAVMSEEEIDITIRLARGEFIETVWTSDLSEDYVRINASYRS